MSTTCRIKFALLRSEKWESFQRRAVRRLLLELSEAQAVLPEDAPITDLSVKNQELRNSPVRRNLKDKSATPIQIVYYFATTLNN
jgi:hypothetical protein